MSGDLTSTVRALELEDQKRAAVLDHPGLPALTALLAQPIAGDVARFALTPEATTLTQRLGSAWAR